MKLKPETVGFVRGGALYLEPVHKWRSWQRDVWTCCGALWMEAPQSVWTCRSCGGRTLHAGRPNFCAYCRSTRLIKVA